MVCGIPGEGAVLRSAEKPHTALDVAGAGNVPLDNAPVLDPAAERQLATLKHTLRITSYLPHRI